MQKIVRYRLPTRRWTVQMPAGAVPLAVHLDRWTTDGKVSYEPILYVLQNNDQPLSDRVFLTISYKQGIDLEESAEYIGTYHDVDGTDRHVFERK